MTWLMVAVGAGGAGLVAAVMAAGFAALGRVLDRSRDWRLDHQFDRRDAARRL